METPAADRLWALVLAGGDGTRLQALTRLIAGAPIPKQYCRIVGDRSLLETTLARIAPLVRRERTLAIVNRGHLSLARPQLAAIPTSNVCAAAKSGYRARAAGEPPRARAPRRGPRRWPSSRAITTSATRPPSGGTWPAWRLSRPSSAPSRRCASSPRGVRRSRRRRSAAREDAALAAGIRHRFAFPPSPLIPKLRPPHPRRGVSRPRRPVASRPAADAVRPALGWMTRGRILCDPPKAILCSIRNILTGIPPLVHSLGRSIDS